MLVRKCEIEKAKGRDYVGVAQTMEFQRPRNSQPCEVKPRWDYNYTRFVVRLEFKIILNRGIVFESVLRHLFEDFHFFTRHFLPNEEPVDDKTVGISIEFLSFMETETSWMVVRRIPEDGGRKINEGILAIADHRVSKVCNFCSCFAIRVTVNEYIGRL